MYLACDLLGQEEVLINVSQTFGAKIYVDKAKNHECFQNLVLAAPEILSEDPSSRFHIFDGSPGLYERAKAKLVEAQAKCQPEPLFVRPSAQWYACEVESSESENIRKKRMNGAVKDQFGVWHVCYSIHSSKEELDWALQLLAPWWVVSTTPSCRAMELGYVKKHCFNTNIALNRSLCKLLDMTMETTTDADATVKSVNCNHMIEETPQSWAQIQSPVKLQPGTETKELVELSVPCKHPVTLFGRARLGLQDISNSRGGCNVIPANDLSQTVLCDAGQESLFKAEDAEVELDNSIESNKDLEARVHKSASYLNIGSSGFSERVRKLYRSMNVPVPEPLPSLVGLLNPKKRAKRG